MIGETRCGVKEEQFEEEFGGEKFSGEKAKARVFQDLTGTSGEEKEGR